MGLIRAAVSTFSSTMADQWKEFFICESIPNDVLMIKGEHKGKSNLFSGNHGSDNVITSGSGIVVADGQCVILVENGKVMEMSSEPGVFTYDSSLEPSFFCGNLGEGFKNLINEMGSRFTYGGVAPKDQRVYYVNTKEILDNKFGTASPIPFRIVDKKINLDLDVSIRCNGLYSYRITNPVAFYENVCANVANTYDRSQLDPQLRTEFVSALQPALAVISTKEVRPSDIPMHVEELCDAMNENLSTKWTKLRGLEVVSVALNPITLTEEDQKMVQDAQRSSFYRDPSMAAGAIAGAQADAMRDAAKNANGAMAGFMGLNMAQSAGGVNANSLYATAATQQQSAPAAPAAGSWTCTCGSVNQGNFCSNCGSQKPTSSFCPDCGKEVPAGAKFCPNCGKQI